MPSCFTVTRADQLTRLLSGHSEIVETPIADDGKKPIYVISQKTDWTALNARVGTTLSPEQATVFEMLTEQKQRDERLTSLSRALLNSSRPANSSKPRS